MINITKIPDWENKSDQEILDYLSEEVDERLPFDATKNNTAWAGGQRIVRDFGATVYEQMLSSLIQAGYPGVAGLLPTGIDFGDPETQLMLDQLRDSIPEVFTEDRVKIMKSWGVKKYYRWEKLYSSLPSLTEIGEERVSALASMQVDIIEIKLGRVLSAAKQAKDAGGDADAVIAAAEAAWAGE